MQCSIGLVGCTKSQQTKEEKEKTVSKETDKKRRRQGVGGNASEKKHYSKDHVSSQFPEATKLLHDWDWDVEDDLSANLKFQPETCPSCQVAFDTDTIICQQLFQLHFILNHIHLDSKQSSE